jgi:hypothetical protein
MNAKSANVFDSFASLVQFYPKLVISIACGVMDLAANSMKPFGSVDTRSAGANEAAPLPPAPARVRPARQPKKKQVAAQKSIKRSTGRRKAA